MRQLIYESFPKDTEEQLIYNREHGYVSPYAFKDSDGFRRQDLERDRATILRPVFIRDIDKILHCPYYNRYTDKTQVFSLHENDDLSRRGLHVQLVSKVARNIGRMLGLNLDLIEAIALGHDMGHTPFGHAGENFLDAILFERTGYHFQHKLQSVRVLDKIYSYNITLQTLQGISAHDGEAEMRTYIPQKMNSFDEFDEQIEKSSKDISYSRSVMPCTLEGCVVRISDIIAYLGKDRQDAVRAKLVSDDDFEDGKFGKSNAEIINNFQTNIVTNSLGKNHISFDEEHFEALKSLKAENYEKIYAKEAEMLNFNETVKPMMKMMFEKLYADLCKGDTSSPVFKHHIRYVSRDRHERLAPYTDEDNNIIVADMIASMTDDYFLELFSHLYPNSSLGVSYMKYFNE